MWRPGRRASSLLIRGGRWSSLADTQITLGKFDDAIASLQSALSQMADDSPTQSLATVSLAKAYAGLGKMEQARSYCRQTDCEPVVPVMKKWRIVRRTILDMELHKYARTSVVPQVLILHGPRGVGKRTTVEGLLQEWRKLPHAVAYVDLELCRNAAHKGSNLHPWMLGTGSQVLNDNCDSTRDSCLGRIREHLEQALESLAVEAVELGCLRSQNVLEWLQDHHSIDHSLSQFLQLQEAGGKLSDVSRVGSTKQMWHEALKQMLDASSAGDTSTSILFAGQVAKLDVKRKAVLSLSLAKQLLQMQEGWRTAAGSARRSRGAIPKGAADAAVSWPMLLINLLSWATQENRFQPKLVINAMDVMRNAALDQGGVDGAAYHDSLLMKVVTMGVTHGCLPIILVSSDSYYSWQIGEDFGDNNVFVSCEFFGWTAKEAAVHLVPDFFTADDWKVVADVLGPNPQHLVELHTIQQSQSFVEQVTSNDSVNIEDCIDIYLAYIQVTVVDPAMDAAVALLENFADKAIRGNIDSQLLQHGAPWRHPPKVYNNSREKQQHWAQLQLMDCIEALAYTEFGVNYLGGGLELLDDPAALALLQVGLLYQQRASPYIRPTSRCILRCLVRWLVRKKFGLSVADRLRYKWHRVVRGRSYRHLMLDS
ncbi:unnamed protein product [Sphagnum troendelagicum]|uniref:Uncharacterized protein n=1 Tax=Sphagnum troendelagicum TaxID=128251 RepID=A0ABP0TT32_9BRYO